MSLMRTEADLPWLAEPLRALLGNERGHALILHGAAGAGVFELALRLAQAWLCENDEPDKVAPCGRCASCHLALARSHTDLRVVMPEATAQQLRWGAGDAEGSAGADADADADGEGKSRKKASKDIKVEAVRQAIDWAHGSSGRGVGKVLVLFPADAMNEIAANALLKTLEEPAAGMRLLLCVDNPARLLPTIRSRCQIARIQPPTEEVGRRWLEAQGVAQADVLLHATGGQPLAALAMAESGWDGAAWAALPGQIRRNELKALAAWPLPQALRALQCLCHDLMSLAVGGPPRFFPGLPAPARLGPVVLAPLVGWSQALARAVRHDEHPWNGGLLLESLAAQGREALAAGWGQGARPRNPGR